LSNLRRQRGNRFLQRFAAVAHAPGSTLPHGTKRRSFKHLATSEQAKRQQREHAREEDDALSRIRNPTRGSVKDGKITAFIPEDPQFGSSEEVAADDQGNVFAGFTNNNVLTTYVKN
jgi:hypothetical protein